MQPRDPGASLEAIQYHYDVSNDFYRLWLDNSLTYSCALWQDNDTLETAQVRKIDWHVEQARAKHATRVLDVGCGWGSLLRRLVDVHGVKHAVGLTLSEAQTQWLQLLPHHGIDVRLESWTHHIPQEPYAAIISIGAFEHFTTTQLSPVEKVAVYRTFFSRCHDWLQPGGWMSLQTIAYGNLRRGKHYANPFIAHDIFPESELPRLHEIAEATEHLFELVTLRNDRADYARTCRVWFERLRANRALAVELCGEAVVARYERFLRTFSYSFELGAFWLLRLTLRRIDTMRI
jgi:cyclopropane-fatty-acyl-phospholipid synthase